MTTLHRESPAQSRESESLDTSGVPACRTEQECNQPDACRETGGCEKVEDAEGWRDAGVALPVEADPLRAGVRQIVTALRNREWADLLTTDSDLADLEEQVGKLIGARCLT